MIAIDSHAASRYAFGMLTQSPRLRPFVAHIDRGAGVPMIAVRGRIEDEVVHISVFGAEVALLPMRVGEDEHGSFAILPSGEQQFGNGLHLSVRARKLGADRAQGLLLSLCSESPALAQARPLFGKLGGDAALVRLLAPSSWSIELIFDADGRYLERASGRGRGGGRGRGRA